MTLPFLRIKREMTACDLDLYSPHARTQTRPTREAAEQGFGRTEHRRLESHLGKMPARTHAARCGGQPKKRDLHERRRRPLPRSPFEAVPNKPDAHGSQQDEKPHRMPKGAKEDGLDTKNRPWRNSRADSLSCRACVEHANVSQKRSLCDPCGPRSPGLSPRRAARQGGEGAARRSQCNSSQGQNGRSARKGRTARQSPRNSGLAQAGCS